MKMILSNLFGFIKAKPRLFIEYIMIGAVVFLFGVSAYLWSQNELSKSRLDTAASNAALTQERLGNMEVENKKLGESVLFLAKQRTLDNESFVRLSKILGDQQADQALLEDKMTKLEASNASVKAYLDERVPDDLRRLLDSETSPESRGASNQSKTPGTPQGKMSGS